MAISASLCLVPHGGRVDDAQPQYSLHKSWGGTSSGGIGTLQRETCALGPEQMIGRGRGGGAGTDDEGEGVRVGCGTHQHRKGSM